MMAAAGQFNSKYDNLDYGTDRGARNIGMSAAEVRPVEIPHQMEKLERTLKGCFEGLAMLSQRLECSVMRAEPPTDTAKEPTALQSTPLSGQLQSLTTTAAHLAARIQSMTARLEV
jgi:hypothetical protein